MGCERVLAVLDPGRLETEHHHLELRPEPRSAGQARRWIRAQAGAGHPRGDDLMLLVSELVTNAVLHARTPLVVGLTPLRDGLLVTVEDQDLLTPTQQPYSDSRTNGRGITLLDAIASRWGVERDGDGKTVWFVVPNEGFEVAQEAG